MSHDDELERLRGIEFVHQGCKHLRERDIAELIEQRDRAIAERDAALAGVGQVLDSYEEWQVTGQPEVGQPPYSFTWSPRRNPQLGDAGLAAKAFLQRLAQRGASWAAGPHLARWIVVCWQPPDPPAS